MSDTAIADRLERHGTLALVAGALAGAGAGAVCALWLHRHIPMAAPASIIALLVVVGSAGGLLVGYGIALRWRFHALRIRLEAGPSGTGIDRRPIRHRPG